MALKDLLNEEQKKRVELFNTTIYIYREQTFEEARDVFNQAFDYILEDPPTKIYVKRCGEYIKNKPDKNWDGVCQFTSKG